MLLASGDRMRCLYEKTTAGVMIRASRYTQRARRPPHYLQTSIGKCLRQTFVQVNLESQKTRLHLRGLDVIQFQQIGRCFGPCGDRTGYLLEHLHREISRGRQRGNSEREKERCTAVKTLKQDEDGVTSRSTSSDALLALISLLTAEHSKCLFTRMLVCLMADVGKLTSELSSFVAPCHFVGGDDSQSGIRAQKTLHDELHNNCLKRGQRLQYRPPQEAGLFAGRRMTERCGDEIEDVIWADLSSEVRFTIFSDPQIGPVANSGTLVSLPEVSLLQKKSWDPVVCHATGYLPKTETIMWTENGKQSNNKNMVNLTGWLVKVGELLQNENGTFQINVTLYVTREE
ncbi:hypothetical protein E1301_Tti013537 [Triplophysa tibetana]|uniref:Ig-like domain-containing protein n=1 Tax=Triplophysa tibetana TaxID=1572043 RepID=A0A5A9NSA1_9TELE|nr:hypothetical protein E1301_Tti013537 [Triplophysa tibetana]